MPFDINKLSTRLHILSRRKASIEQDYKRQIAEIDAEIAQEKAVLDKISEVLKPYICKGCGGSGEETYTDAAGSRDWRKCRCCGGSGIA